VAPRDLFDRDPDAYLEAFDLFDTSQHTWNEDELNLVNGIAEWMGSQSEALDTCTACGYLSALFEDWEPALSAHRVETLARTSLEAEFAEELPPDWAETIFLVLCFREKTPELVPKGDPGLLSNRLSFLFERVILAKFERSLSPEEHERCARFYRTGVAAGLYVQWRARMDELGIPEGQRVLNWEFVEPEDDPLRDLELPVQLHGCELRKHGLWGYEIVSTGKLGGRHRTCFSAEGHTARVFHVERQGPLGQQSLDVPTLRHGDVFRSLGIAELRLPSGKRYRFGTWPGVRRVKD
jgi:hypothetical protein